MSGPANASHDDLRAFLRHTPDLVARLDSELRYRFVSSRARELTGIRAERWLGRRTEELRLDPQRVRPLIRILEAARDTGESQQLLAPMELGSRKRRRWFEAHAVPDEPNDEDPTGLVLFARDVTQRVEAHHRLDETRSLLARTLESLSDAVFVVSHPGRRILECNQAAEQIFGWSREELVGSTTEGLHVDERSFLAFASRARQALEAGRSFRARARMRRRDGTVFPTEHTVTLLEPGEGPEAGAVSVVRDRTDERRAEEELAHYHRRLRALRTMDREILEAGSSTAVAKAAARHAHSITGCHRVSVTLTEKGREGARLAAVQDEQGDASQEGTWLPLCPFSEDEARPGKPILIRDMADPAVSVPQGLGHLAERGLRGLVTVPLGNADELLGGLTLAFAAPLPESSRDIDVAQEVADHLTLGIREIHLREAVRTETRGRLGAEERVSSLERRLDELLEGLDVGFLRATLDGTIVEENGAAGRLLGVERGQTLMGRTAVEILGPGESWERIVGELESQADGGTSQSLEVEIRRADGETRWLWVLARITRDAQGQRVAEGVFEDVTEEMELRREVVAISARERQRLGQDLHDDLGQHLAGLALLAASLGRRLEKAGLESASEARELERMVGLAVRKTRHLARGVHPPALEPGGLPGALEELAREVEKLFGLPVSVEVDPGLGVSTDFSASHLYRIAQEALSNAARHGAATEATVSWALESGARVLTIRDDGAGFGPEEQESRGLGLRIMRYRARLLGGRLDVRSRPGEGTRVRVELPGRDPSRAAREGS